MEPDITPASTFSLIGGRLCLDFTNTIGLHSGENDNDKLTSYSRLVEWSRQAGILDDRQAEDLLVEADRRPEEAQAILERAITLREAIYRVFAAVAHDRSADQADLDLLNDALAEALAHLQIVQVEGSYGWNWAGGDGRLDRMLWPVVRSAADTLSGPELHRVGQCAGEKCDWLFLDTSKNHSRRWCAMNDCGNRFKVRRHYERRRAS